MSFVPPQEIRKLRGLTRLRKKWIDHVTSEKNEYRKRWSLQTLNSA